VAKQRFTQTARAANDAHFAEVRRAFVDFHDGLGDAFVSMTFDEYERARRDDSHPVVAPGHAPADAAVVVRRSRFELVEPARE
jgi:hypothetical protein